MHTIHRSDFNGKIISWYDLIHLKFKKKTTFLSVVLYVGIDE